MGGCLPRALWRSFLKQPFRTPNNCRFLRSFKISRVRGTGTRGACVVRNRDRRPAESAAEEAGERAAAEAALREQLRRAAERHSAPMAELDA